MTKEKSPYSLSISDNFSESELTKQVWLVILHASRTPPHIGILINGNYNSLTIKGHELNINSQVLLRTIKQKQIETLCIQLKQHPVFSLDFQKEIFQYNITQFEKVEPHNASCLSPVKIFLQEFYALTEIKNELLFELIERLKTNGYIVKTGSLNLHDVCTDGIFTLPIYTNQKLTEIIIREVSTLKK